MSFLPNSERLSENFTVGEFTDSDTAEELGIDNRIERGSSIHVAALALVRGVLQPIRDDMGSALYITSGYRCDELNKAVGGSPQSQHMLGEAADLVSPRMEPLELARFIEGVGVRYDQLILEHDQGVVHLSYSKLGNRRETLTRGEKGGGLVYRYGVLEEAQV